MQAICSSMVGWNCCNRCNKGRASQPGFILMSNHFRSIYYIKVLIHWPTSQLHFDRQSFTLHKTEYSQYVKMQDSKAFQTAINFVALSKRGTFIETMLDGYANCLVFNISYFFIYLQYRYIQVGNAVAMPVALALGYAFGLASQGLCDDNPLITLPFKFPECLSKQFSMAKNVPSSDWFSWRWSHFWPL